MRKWAYDSNVLLHWLVRLLPTAWVGGRSGALRPPTSVPNPGQLLWAMLDWLFDWLFWLPDCCPLDCWPWPPPG